MEIKTTEDYHEALSQGAAIKSLSDAYLIDHRPIMAQAVLDEAKPLFDAIEAYETAQFGKYVDAITIFNAKAVSASHRL